MPSDETIEERWQAFSSSRSHYPPASLLARVVWEGLEELRRTRRELRRIRRQLEDRGTEEPTIASDLGALARIADPLVEAVEGLAGSVDAVESTLDRLRLQGDPRDTR
jgi:hypothetical protein